MTHKWMLLGAATAALLVTAAAANAQIVRHHSGPTPGMLLESVTLPANAELLILSGSIASPIDPDKTPSSLADYGDTKTQTISALNNIRNSLAKRGYSMSDVIKLTVFLTADPSRSDGKMDFAGMNEGFRMFFGTAENPNTVARSTVQISALAGPYYLVEIEATAAKAPSR